MDSGSVHVVPLQLFWLLFDLCPLCRAAQRLLTASRRSLRAALGACVLHYDIAVAHTTKLGTGTEIQGCASLVLQLTQMFWYVLNQVPRIQPS